MTDTKRMHYVPRSLLRHFAAEDGNLAVYDKEKSRWFHASPNNAGVEKNIYLQEDETWLANSVENPALSPLDRLRSGEQIGFDERKIIAKYIWTLARRVPAIRELTDTVFTSKNIYPVVKETRDQVEAISRLFPNRAISAQEQQDIDRWLDLAREAPTELMTELGMADLLKVGLQSETSLWEFLPELAWRVVFSSQTRYIITDKPVTSFKLQDGANDPRFELFIPLSTRCTLHISRQGKPRTLQTDIVDEALARTLNTRTLTGAYRFVFCSREETWVSKNAHRHPSQVRTPGVRWGVSDIISIPYGEHCKLCGHVFTEQEFNDADISYSGKVVDGTDVLETTKVVPHWCRPSSEKEAGAGTGPA